MEWDGTLVVLATPPMSGALWDDSRKRVEREVKWFAITATTRRSVPLPSVLSPSQVDADGSRSQGVTLRAATRHRAGLGAHRTKPGMLHRMTNGLTLVAASSFSCLLY